MPEPDVLQQQRQLLNAFRGAAAVRSKAEADADARYKAEQQAAEADRQRVHDSAKAQRTAAENTAQAKRKSEEMAAETSFSRAQQMAATKLDEIAKAQKSAQESLAWMGQTSLLNTTAGITPGLGAGEKPADKLTHSAETATKAANALGELAQALYQQRTEARTRRVLTYAGIACLFVVVISVLVNNMLRKEEERNRATATVQAAAIQATATTQAIASEATVTSLLARLKQQTGMEMVYVSGGEFVMGSSSDEANPDESPQHTVNLDAFWIDQTEVTVAQYHLCVKANACTVPDTGGKCNYDSPGGAEYPVNCLDWHQSATYCMWADKRLPTEAEWEKAAGGTDGRIYPWGNTWADIKGKSSLPIGPGTTSPVGSLLTGRSPYGALDMAGNVWEWVADWYDKSYYVTSSGKNPQGPETGLQRVIRGGDLFSMTPSFRPITIRRSHLPTHHSNSIGFRCARSP